MKKILLSMAALSALAIATPASAQLGVLADSRIDVRINDLQSRIQAGVQQGSISRQEAQSLRAQLRELSRLERQYSRDGLSRGERQELQQRIQSLRQNIRTAEMSGGGRDGRWGDRDGDRFERDCPPGLEKRNNGCVPPGQVGRDGRWEDRRDDRDDRWEDRREDRDERWEDRRDDRDDRRDDRWDDRDRDGYGIGGLRVGQRVTAGLGAVPYQYRNQYRDGGGVYHRSDGRNIYRIDARTHVVLQVYALNR
jgi:hypothetical protein